MGSGPSTHTSPSHSSPVLHGVILTLALPTPGPASQPKHQFSLTYLHLNSITPFQRSSVVSAPLLHTRAENSLGVTASFINTLLFGKYKHIKILQGQSAVQYFKPYYKPPASLKDQIHSWQTSASDYSYRYK